MKSNILLRFCASLAILALLSGTSRAVLISTMPVGAPGNAPGRAINGSNYGAVAYNYRIGTYDVTNAQYVEFLNAKASAADPYGLWNSNMAPGGLDGAISRSGSGPNSYSVKPGYANKPVVDVSWYDAVRFANWLTNGQGNGDTETGTYLITGGGNNSGTVLVPDATQRALWAATNSFHWLLPSENEWYKAAYYNPANATYYLYPFQSNSQPAALAPPGNTNSGDFNDVAYNYDGNGSYSTDVGSYPNSLSPFGSLDMGGDVFQWNDTPIGSSRGLRGASWNNHPNSSADSFRIPIDPSFEGSDAGFRVASVPEPRSILLTFMGLSGFLIFSKRLRANLYPFRPKAPCVTKNGRMLSGEGRAGRSRDRYGRG